MKIRIVVAAGLALAACDNSPDVTHYVLALSWQPAFCEFNRDRPECPAGGLAPAFDIEPHKAERRHERRGKECRS